MESIGTLGGASVPIARPPSRATQVHRLSCSAETMKIVRTIMLIETTCTHGCSVLTMTTLAFPGGSALKQVVSDVGHSGRQSAISCPLRPRAVEI